MQHVRPSHENKKLLETQSELVLRSKGEQSRLATTAFLIVLTWGLSEGRSFLIPLCIAALVAFLMVPLVKALRKIGAPEWLAVSLTFLVLLLPLLGSLYILAREVQSVVHDFPNIQRGIKQAITTLTTSSLGVRLNLATHLDPAQLTKRLVSGAGEALQMTLKGLGVILSAGSQGLLVLLFAVLMLVARAHLRLCGERILASSRPLVAKEMLDAITQLIERFLMARFLIVLIIAMADLAILVAFRIDYAFLLATFLGIMTLVPAIGFILALIPPVVMSIIDGHSAWMTTAMSLALFGMSIVEGNVLTPRMVGKQLNLNALTTFVALFAGSLLWGMWGMILAIPVTGILRIAFNASPRLRPWGDLLADKPATPNKAVVRGKAGHA